jgi:hypothetical protein
MPAFTRLGAINRMLQAAGEQPVNTLVSDGTNDVSLAESVLDDSIKEILSQGLNFNTEVKDLYKDASRTDHPIRQHPVCHPVGERYVPEVDSAGEPAL